MEKRLVYFIFLIFISLTFEPVSSVYAQSMSPKKAEKLAAKKKRDQLKNQEKTMKEAKKAFRKMQTKDVQKRMRISEKAANRNRDNKPYPFYKRWFRKGRK